MDAKPIALKRLNGAKSIVAADIEALPEEALTRKFGDATRTVADIVFELNLVNDHIARAVRGEQQPPWPEGGWITAPAEFSSKESILGAFGEKMDVLIALAEGMDEADFATVVETEMGSSTKFEQFIFASMHNWYHSGQFNYIQTLLGDSDWHW